VVITDGAIHGGGRTPEEAWQNAIAHSATEVLSDAQRYDVAPGGAMIGDHLEAHGDPQLVTPLYISHQDVCRIVRAVDKPA
jgi:hypothetical protein